MIRYRETGNVLENMNIRKLGLLTSGGDCAGLNAVIRAVVHRASGHYGWQVLGIRQGTHGLLSRPPMVEELTADGPHASILRLGSVNAGRNHRQHQRNRRDGTQNF